MEPGLYPILPVKRTWKLDKNRKPSVLKVHRKQIPLVPAFAITAHASQGKTLPLGRTAQRNHRPTGKSKEASLPRTTFKCKLESIYTYIYIYAYLHIGKIAVCTL